MRALTEKRRRGFVRNEFVVLDSVVED